jgi:hypothetical protein
MLVCPRDIQGQRSISYYVPPRCTLQNTVCPYATACRCLYIRWSEASTSAREHVSAPSSILAYYSKRCSGMKHSHVKHETLSPRQTFRRHFPARTTSSSPGSFEWWSNRHVNCSSVPQASSLQAFLVDEWSSWCGAKHT